MNRKLLITVRFILYIVPNHQSNAITSNHLINILFSHCRILKIKLRKENLSVLRDGSAQEL